MATDCKDPNQTLDPMQTIIDQTESKVDTLETQATAILPDVESFRAIGDAFDPADISQSSVVNSALNEMTAEALCASSTNLSPINDLTEDCLNEAIRGVKRYINDMLQNMEDGIDLIDDILALPENTLMKLLQKIWKLCANMKDLIGGIDKKLTCVSLSEQAAEYQDQIDALNTRVDTVTDDLYLADDGSFDAEKLTDGFNTDLQDNVLAYKTRSDNLQEEIVSDIGNTVDLTASVNPRNYF